MVVEIILPCVDYERILLLTIGIVLFIVSIILQIVKTAEIEFFSDYFTVLSMFYCFYIINYYFNIINFSVGC